ncbi:MAG: DUF5689 domain-containing protein [Bergeyella sp.]
MKTVKFLKTIVFAIALLAVNTACVHDDDYSNPPVECNDFQNTVTIADIKALYSGSTVQITEDLVLEGYVVSSDETGNIYKTIYIQDAPENPTQGLTVSVDATDTYTKFPVGSKIFIKVKNLYLGSYGGVIQLGDVSKDENGAETFGRIAEAKYNQIFFKGCGSPSEITPKVVTITELSSLDDLVGALIQIDGVEFVDGVLGTTYATSGSTVNKNLEDCSGNTILLRNSGYSTFFNELLPEGKGPIVAIYSKYSSDKQLYIRDTNDTAGMTGKRCFVFNDSFANLSKWTAVNVAGAQVWGVSNAGGTNYYAVMNGYANSTNNANEDWLVSNEMDLSGYTSVTLTFKSDVRYSGTALKLYITDNYTGDPNTTTWTDLTSAATWDTNSSAWGLASSGDVSLNAFVGKKIKLAFKYVSTTSASNTWEVDDVIVKGS